MMPGVQRQALVVTPDWVLENPRADDVVPPMKYSTGVSDDGSATAEIPIWSPVGRNGIEPHLTLSYRSRGGRGLAGQGFQLSGMSMIERCWKTPASDGTFSVTEIPDEFCLDGRRLIRDQTPQVFFPEGDPGTKVVQVSLGDHFVVYSKDGTTTAYGRRNDLSGALSSQSKVLAMPTALAPSEPSSDRMIASLGPKRTVAWLKDGVEDRWGNYMNFDYERMTGAGIPQDVEVRPKKIVYTGNSKSSPALVTTRQVSFSYKAASIAQFRRVAGVLIRSASLISSISISAENRSSAGTRPASQQLLRRYDLTFLPVGSGTRVVDRLSSIKECFAKVGGEICSAPLAFTWSGTTTPRLPSFTLRNSIAANGIDIAMSPATHEMLFDILDSAVGDFNGDGYDDYLVRTPNGVKFPRGTDAQGRDRIMFGARWHLSMGSATGLTAPTLTSLPGSAGSSNSLGARVMDLNGDGNDDVVLVSDGLPPYDVQETQTYGAFIWSGTDFSLLPSTGETLSALHGINTPSRSASFVLGDMDGDGIVDLATDDAPPNQVDPNGLWFRRGSTASPSGFSFVTGSAIVANPIGFNRPVPGQEKHLLDVDGNGTVELLGRVHDMSPGAFAADGLSATLQSFSLTGPPSSLSARDTKLWAKDLTLSVVASSAVGATCSGQVTRSYLNRIFLDVDGDGLKDSVSIPQHDKDTCSPVRNWNRLVFTALNLGGAFGMPQAQTLPASLTPTDFTPNRIGPTLVPETGVLWHDRSVGTYLDPGALLAVDDRTGSQRTIDTGVRVADFDADGRDDLVIVGGLVPSLGGVGAIQRNILVALSNGTTFEDPLDTGLRGPRSLSNLDPDNSDITFGIGTRGSGPRSGRLGDFNGDGQFDIAFADWASGTFNAVSILTQTQNSRVPDAITSISGGKQTATVEFQYSFMGPSWTGNLTSRGPCSVGQRCARKFGWIVSKLRNEVNKFDDPASEWLETDYRYGTPTFDTRGRGFLGFRNRKTTTAGLVEDQERDLSTRTSLANGGYTYSGSRKQTVSTTTPDGLVSSVTGTSTSFVDSRAGFAINTISTDTLTTEAGVETRHMSEQQYFDEYANGTKRSTMWFEPGDKKFSYYEERLTGTNDTDEWTWLVTRYPRVEVESREYAIPHTEVRTTELVYESASPEVKTVIVEPDGALDSVGVNGVKLTTTFHRDVFGNVEQVESTNDDQVRSSYVQYDSLDKQFPVKRTNALSHEEVVYWNTAFGIAFSSDDPNGVRERTSFDAFLRPHTVHTAVLAADNVTSGGPVIEHSYRVQGPLLQRKRAYFRCANSSAGGGRCSSINPAGRSESDSWDTYSATVLSDNVFDQLGRLTGRSLPRRTFGETPAFINRTYDRLGRILTQTRPGETLAAPRVGQSWSYLPNEIAHTDERNIKSVVSLDAKGRRKESLTIEPSSSRKVRVGYQYQAFDLLRTTIHPPANVPMNPPPAALVTVMSYDVLGRVISLADPDVGTETRLYSAFGELKEATDANDGVTTTTYDVLGRPVRVQTPANRDYPAAGNSSFAQDSTFNWDTAVPGGVGKLDIAHSAQGPQYSATYDSFGRPETMKWKVDGVEYLFTNTYDAVGHLKSLHYPDSAVGAPFAVQFEYGLNGMVQSIYEANFGLPAGPKAPPPKLLWHGVSQHPSGAIDDQQFGGGLRDTRRFDAAHQLRFAESKSVFTNAIVQKLAYKWGDGGFLASKTDLAIGVGETYAHDFLGRLSNWTVVQNCKQSALQYNYDDLGNLLKREILQGPGDDVVLEYTSLSDILHPHGVKRIVKGSQSLSYTYKTGGQAEFARDLNIQWTPFGLPLDARDNWHQSTYEYDPFGSRVRAVERSGGGWARDVITLEGLFEKTVTPSGSTFAYNVIGPEGPVAQVRRELGTGGEATAVHFFHPDQLGTPETITDGLGGVVERLKFDPFGERRHSWSVGHPVPEHSVVNETVGFTGHHGADGFGLINMKGRIYDPRAARFLSPDPFVSGRSEGLNRYSYVRNSPIMRIDPSGFFDVASAMGHAASVALSSSQGEGSTGQLTPPANPHRFETVVRDSRPVTTANDQQSSVTSNTQQSSMQPFTPEQRELSQMMGIVNLDYPPFTVLQERDGVPSFRNRTFDPDYFVAATIKHTIVMPIVRFVRVRIGGGEEKIYFACSTGLCSADDQRDHMEAFVAFSQLALPFVKGPPLPKPPNVNIPDFIATDSGEAINLTPLITCVERRIRNARTSCDSAAA